MADFPSKRKVNVAVSKKNTFDLTKSVMTTNDFGRIKPIECRYMVPGDTFNVKLSTFTRALPMVSPTFGKIDIINRAYFVPCRSVQPYFNEFITNNYARVGATGVNVGIIYTSVGDFIYEFLSNGTLMAQKNPTTPTLNSQYDFYLRTDVETLAGNTISDSAGYYNFTKFGRHVYDLLKSLGLNLNFDSTSYKVKINLLPLIAFWKTYWDWIVPSRWVNQQNNVEGLINYVRQHNSGNNYVGYDYLHGYLLQPMYSYFDQDYITSAFRDPFNPEHLANDTVITNPARYNDSSPLNGATDADTSDGRAIGSHISTVVATQNPNSFINAFTVESLGKLQDYLNRGMLAGSKIQDWLLTEFGMRPSTDALNLSTYLGKQVYTMRIGDVMSNADTFDPDADTGVMLGGFAGTAVGGNESNFSYSAKEHGYFIITSEIVPKTSYYQGLTPEFSMLDRLDFFQPEFDNMGVEAISEKELFFSSKKIIGNTTEIRPDNVFGFQPRYSKLKTAFDVVSGDFANRFGENLKSWYLSRDVEKLLYNLIPTNRDFINENFARVAVTWQNWDRIFNYSEADTDHFYQIFIVENKAERPMLSVADALNPEHPNGNKEVTIKAHGGVE